MNDSAFVDASEEAFSPLYKSSFHCEVIPSCLDSKAPTADPRHISQNWFITEVGSIYENRLLAIKSSSGLALHKFNRTLKMIVRQ
jgi:hypothetical protein